MTGFRGLRIALVGPLPPPAGGMANQTRQLAELLRAAQAQVSLVQTNAPYRPAWVARFGGVRALCRLLPFLAALWRTVGRSDLVHVMANSGWSWHLFAAPAVWIAHLRRVPVIVNYRGGEAAAFLAGSGRWVRSTMRLSAALVVPSGFLEQVFASHSMSARVVPNIVNLQRFSPAMQPGHASQHLMVARNLEPLYDNETALRVLALVREQLPDAHMTIAGTGPDAERLRALVVALGLENVVHFAGRLTPDEMAALYRTADVSLNPSLADNMPNSVLESLASGVPVVSTDVGGVPFLVKHESTALLVPPRDARAMAQAVLRLVDDPALRQRLVITGLQEVRRYTWDQVAPQLADVYQSALSTAAA
jgi:glycosyltransferase involved in cell wall biosynthesis